MKTGVDRILEMFEEETDPNVLSLDEQIDFTVELISELEQRLNSMEDSQA